MIYFVHAAVTHNFTLVGAKGVYLLVELDHIKYWVGRVLLHCRLVLLSRCAIRSVYMDDVCIRYPPVIGMPGKATAMFEIMHRKTGFCPPEHLFLCRVFVRSCLSSKFLSRPGFHGAPADADAWESCRAETISDIFFPMMPTVPHGIPANVWTQAMHAPKPMGSPALSSMPFSLRPDGSGRMVGLLDVLGVHNPIVPASPAVALLSAPRSPQPQCGALSLRMPWTGGWTHVRSALALNPHVITRNLTLFHRAVLEQAPDNPTATHEMIGRKRCTCLSWA
ncbi:hypothetical protein B0H14DRAFT_3700499 [Mycena olivaceomarginata]|nr:hypothetical protein B0H14DRAFT_3700499 [Mycena olivaceomarginata]